MFNLTSHQRFNGNDHKQRFNSNDKEAHHIFLSKNAGPVFGFPELAATKEPFNRELGCISCTDEIAYRIPKDKKGIN